MKIIKKIIILLCIILMFLFLTQIPLFHVISTTEAEQLLYDKDDGFVTSILGYTYTTGAGWIIEKCDREGYIGKSAIIKCHFDPRLLKINTDYSVDYGGKIVVESVSEKPINYEGEDVMLLVSKKIYLILDDKTIKTLTLDDMMMWGLFKSFLSLFSSSYRYSL